MPRPGPTPAQTPTSVSIDLPLRLQSIANLHGRVRDRIAATKGPRDAVGYALNTRGRPPSLPALVEIRVSRARRLDSDNLVTACKPVRDAVAAWLGINDRSDLIGWVISQVRGNDRLEVTIRAVPSPSPDAIVVRRAA